MCGAGETPRNKAESRRNPARFDNARGLVYQDAYPYITARNNHQHGPLILKRRQVLGQVRKKMEDGAK